MEEQPQDANRPEQKEPEQKPLSRSARFRKYYAEQEAKERKRKAEERAAGVDRTDRSGRILPKTGSKSLRQ